jgi:hypothetical protein
MPSLIDVGRPIKAHLSIDAGLLAAIDGLPRLLDWYGTPYAEAKHIVERYRMLDYAAAKDGFDRDAKEHNPVQGDPNDAGKYLQLEFTTEDGCEFACSNLLTGQSRKIGQHSRYELLSARIL